MLFGVDVVVLGVEVGKVGVCCVVVCCVMLSESMIS